MTDALPLVSACAEIESTLAKLEGDELVKQMSEVVSATLDNPMLPMFARIAAMSMLIGGSAVGAIAAIEDDHAQVTQFHRHDLVPDIAAMLRASATIYEELARQLADAAPQPPAGAPANDGGPNGRKDGNKLDG